MNEGQRIRDHFQRPMNPEWVRRIEAARPQIETLEGMLAARRVGKAIEEAVEYIDSLARQHADGEHDEQRAGAHPECEACLLVLSAEELLREHRGW